MISCIAITVWCSHCATRKLSLHCCVLISLWPTSTTFRQTMFICNGCPTLISKSSCHTLQDYIFYFNNYFIKSFLSFLQHQCEITANEWIRIQNKSTAETGSLVIECVGAVQSVIDSTLWSLSNEKTTDHAPLHRNTLKYIRWITQNHRITIYAAITAQEIVCVCWQDNLPKTLQNFSRSGENTATTKREKKNARRYP